MLKKIFNKDTWSAWIVIGISFVIAIISMGFLPDTIPVHFGMDGTADGYGSKWCIFLFPCISAVCRAAAEPLRNMDPKKNNYKRFDGFYNRFFFWFSLCFLIIEIANIIVAAGYELNMAAVILVCIGILLFLIGNSLPKIKQNYFMGIRTPWVLADETVWYKTHRFGGKVFTIGGILLVIDAFLPSGIRFGCFCIIVIFMIILPCIYSFIIYRKKQ